MGSVSSTGGCDRLSGRKKPGLRVFPALAAFFFAETAAKAAYNRLGSKSVPEGAPPLAAGTTEIRIWPALKSVHDERDAGNTAFDET